MFVVITTYFAKFFLNRHRTRYAIIKALQKKTKFHFLAQKFGFYHPDVGKNIKFDITPHLFMVFDR